MIYIQPNAWVPQGINELEPNALSVVKEHDHNIIVTAGPGAGKTELLAQKATYLLMTGLCKNPKRILAISFKRDAAKNLKDRVELRCGTELASRFDSMTFDAFSKSLLDRFCKALPPIWQPSIDYQIDFELFYERNLRTTFEKLRLSEVDIQKIQLRSFEQNFMTNSILNIKGPPNDSFERILAKDLWNYFLREKQPSTLSFSMIGRLAELIIRTNPKLLLALQTTYSHIFLDEFQDTTDIQYDLTKSCFKNCNSLLTAVGDNKQRIMGWARALNGVFDHFQSDFNAQGIRLIRNYRSAPNLVKIQHVIAQALEGKNVAKAESMNLSHGKGECEVFSFDNCDNEAHHMTTLIKNIMQNDKLSPRDICILTRQTPDRYTTKLISSLQQKGIKSRIETEFQDILSEPITPIILNTLKLIVRQDSSEAWKIIKSFLENIYDEQYIELITQNTNTFIKKARKDILKTSIDKTILQSLIENIITCFDKNILINEFKQYKQGPYLQDQIGKIIDNLYKYYEQTGNDISKAIELFEGNDFIPIMTMHKSKGLEFHTVIFLGLEDAALWNYESNPTEETNGFFVAFSRAKNRIIFTISFQRIMQGRTQHTSIEKIKPLYQLLESSGIVMMKELR